MRVSLVVALPVLLARAGRENAKVLPYGYAFLVLSREVPL